MRLLRNEHGLSLLEVLAALLIFGMVTSIIYSMLFMSMSVYKKVLVEGEMRSRGEAVFSRIIGELKDAEYVQNGREGDGLSIVYSKRSKDPASYVEQYEMRVYPEADGTNSDIEIRDGEGNLVQGLDLGSRFTIKSAELSAPANDAVRLLLVYGYKTVQRQLPAQDADMKIDTRIPLFRSN